MGVIDEGYLRLRQHQNIETDPEAGPVLNQSTQWGRVDTLLGPNGMPQRVGVDEEAGIYRPLETEAPKARQEIREEDGEKFVVEINEDGSEWLLGRVGGKLGAGMQIKPPRSTTEGEGSIPNASPQPGPSQPAPQPSGLTDEAIAGAMTGGAPPKQEDGPTIVGEIGRGLATGADQAVQEILKTTRLDAVADWLEQKVPLGSFAEIDKTSTIAGGVATGVGQAAVGMLPAAKLTRALSAVSQFVRWTTAGALVDFGAFSPEEDNFGDLAKEIGEVDAPTLEAIRGTLADALAKDLDDTEVEKRLKNMGGGVLAGAAIGGVVSLYRAARVLKSNPGMLRDLRRMFSSTEAKKGFPALSLFGGVQSQEDGTPQQAPEDGQQIAGVFDRLLRPILRSAADGAGGGGRPAVKLTGKELGDFGSDAKALRAAAREAYRNLQNGGPAQHPTLGEVAFTQVGRNKAKRTAGNPLKMQMIPKLREIVESAEIKQSAEAGRARNDGMVRFHWGETTVEVDGAPYRVGVQIGEDANGRKFYNFNEDLAAWAEKYQPPGQSLGIKRGTQGAVDAEAPEANIDPGTDGFNLLLLPLPSMFEGGDDVSKAGDGRIQLAGMGDSVLKALIKGAAKKGSGEGVDAATPALKKLLGEADSLATPWQPYRAGDPLEGVDFNFSKIETTAGAKQQINAVSEAYAKQIDKVKGGVVPQAITQDLADLIAVNPSEVNAILEGFEAGAVQDLHVKALVMRKTLVSSAEELDALARRVSSGGETVTDAEYLAFREHLVRHANLQAQMKGVQTEIGRALASFRIPADAPSVQRAQAARELLDNMGGSGTVRELAERYLNTPLEKRAEFVKKAAGTRIKDAVFEAWINGLLSSPRTHEVNILSNVLFATVQIPERLLAGGFGRLLPRGPEADRVYFTETLAMVTAAPKGIEDGIRLAWQAFKHEAPTDALAKVEAAQRRAITADNFGLDPEGLFGKGIDLLGQGIRLPGRFLMAEDEFFKSVAYRMELNAQGVRRAFDARAQGASPEEAAGLYSKILNEGDEVARDAARDFASTVTFTRDLGQQGQAVQRAASAIPMGRVVVPFIRTPANIVKEFGKRSPLALAMPKSFWAEVSAGGARRDLALAKLSLGSSLMAWGASLAVEGKITGGGPTDPALKKVWLETHAPYSVKFNGEWVPYGRMEPVATLFGVAADFAEFSQFKEPGADDDQLAAQAVAAILQNLGEKTFLQGIGDAAAAWHDSERYLGQFMQKLSGSVIPTGIADVESAINPTRQDSRVDPNDPFFKRQFYSSLNAIQARTPGWSEDMPTERTFWGEPIKAFDGHWANAFWAFRTKDMKASVIDEEMLRLVYPLAKPQRELEGVNLSPQQYDRLLVLMNEIKGPETDGKTMREFFNAYVSTEDYLLVGDADKIERLQKILNVFKKAASKKLQEEDPELMARVVTARALKGAGLSR